MWRWERWFRRRVHCGVHSAYMHHSSLSPSSSCSSSPPSSFSSSNLNLPLLLSHPYNKSHSPMPVLHNVTCASCSFILCPTAANLTRLMSHPTISCCQNHARILLLLLCLSHTLSVYLLYDGDDGVCGTKVIVLMRICTCVARGQASASTSASASASASSNLIRTAKRRFKSRKYVAILRVLEHGTPGSSSAR